MINLGNTWSDSLRTGKHVLVAILCFFLVDSAGFSSRIVYPRNATTAIVEAGSSFVAWFDADDGHHVTSLKLRSPYKTISISSFTQQKGSWVYDTVSGNVYNTRLAVSVPAGTPADRYDIIVNTAAGETISRRAVKVIQAYKSEYTIMHISDTHMCQGAIVNGHPERLFKVSVLADIANILGVEMVFVTGDLINNKNFPASERVDFFYEGFAPAGLKGIHGFNAATFVSAGNHDFQEGQLPGTGYYREKAQLWNECHGLQYHHFEYGNTRCMIVNDGWVGYDWTDQLAEHVSWLNRAGKGTLRLAAYHKSEHGIMGAWANEIDLGLAMIGHNHHLAKDNPYPLGGKTIQYYANSLREHFSFNLYRVRHDGSYTVMNNVDAVENPTDDPSLWRPRLALVYAHPNDGNTRSNAVTLINQFDFKLPDARIRFVMPKGPGYMVSNGTILQVFDGPSVHIVDVSVAVDPNSAVSLQIQPSKIQ